METEISRIYGLAQEFRAAIERCDKKFLPVTFENFPRGSCGDAALVLAKYLEDAGCGSFDYILGVRQGHSHAWLARGDLIVDITADQFASMPPVMVALTSDWHAEFEREQKHAADYNIFDSYTQNVLSTAYAAICREVGRRHATAL